ncbi:MAG: gliding motility-associated C-terminal domain-containing protein [Flavobacteriales bacterium]|nr:gliding motility-associated C-terminal domain-containing protein [Flavobacteriales bacterium]
MKKNLLFLLFMGLIAAVRAQCPLDVQIASTPDVTTIEVCKGDTVRLEANPSAGAITPQYIWVVNGDTIPGFDSLLTLTAYNQNVQVYMATNTGCSPDTVTAAIQIQTVLIQPTVTILDSKCNPEVADIQINSTGGKSPYSYNLVGIDTSSTGYYEDVPAGTYTLLITDSAGCNDTAQITVTPIPNDIITEAFPIIEECNLTEADVYAHSKDGTSPYTYELEGIETNTTGNFTGVTEGTYMLYVTDSDGCTDTVELVVDLYTCPPPIPSEVITPNEDGYNDGWYVRNIELYPENEVFIYDRWGQRVYHKKEYVNTDPWDVKYIGANMPVSTYYYILKYVDNDEEKVMNGAISVFR